MANNDALSGNANEPPKPSPFGTFGQSNNAASVFGGAASTGNANPSLFGGNAAAQTPLFGGAPTSGIFGSQSQSNAAKPVFGNGSGLSFGLKSDSGSAPASATTPSFGLTTPSKPSTADAQAQSQTPSLFGNATFGNSTPTNNPSSSIFGNFSTTPAGPPPAGASNGLFGSSQPAAQVKPLFGAASGSTQPVGQGQSTSSFPVFGNKDTSSAAGASNTPTNTAPSSLFAIKPSASNTETSSFSGSKDPVSSVSQNGTSSSSIVFGLPSQTATTAPPSASLFGPNAVTANTFGSQQQPAPLSAGLFGKPQEAKDTISTQGNTNTDQPKPSPFTLGSAPSGSKANSIFGGMATSQSQSTAAPSTDKPSLFGNPSSGLGPTASLFGKASDPAVPKSADAGAPASLFANANSGSASKPNLFGNLAAKKDEPAAAAEKPGEAANGGLHSLGAATGTAPALGIATTQTTTGTANATASTSAAAATGTNLGSSTAGPAPTPQSRLKNKSMDEIITRWASDLSKYQKEFQTQAAKVSSWDRALVQNSNDISKLYSRTFQAERDTVEVQKQLSIVEGHQDELEQWLHRYEKEVDELMARQVGQGEALQGPDQERERTYDQVTSFGRIVLTTLQV